MNKIGLVISREYLSRVKKKSFLLTTILVPLIIVGFYAVIIAISVSDTGDKARVALIDKAGFFTENYDRAKNDATEYVVISGETEQSYKGKYKSNGYDYLLVIPEVNINQPKGIKLHSPSAVSLGIKSKIENTVNKI